MCPPPQSPASQACPPRRCAALCVPTSLAVHVGPSGALTEQALQNTAVFAGLNIRVEVFGLHELEGGEEEGDTGTVIMPTDEVAARGPGCPIEGCKPWSAGGMSQEEVNHTSTAVWIITCLPMLAIFPAIFLCLTHKKDDSKDAVLMGKVKGRKLAKGGLVGLEMLAKANPLTASPVAEAKQHRPSSARSHGSHHSHDHEHKHHSEHKKTAPPLQSSDSDEDV